MNFYFFINIFKVIFFRTIASKILMFMHSFPNKDSFFLISWNLWWAGSFVQTRDETVWIISLPLFESMCSKHVIWQNSLLVVKGPGEILKFNRFAPNREGILFSDTEPVYSAFSLLYNNAAMNLSNRKIFV